MFKLYNYPEVYTFLGFENIIEIERKGNPVAKKRKGRIILCNSFLTSRQILSFKNYFSDQDIKMNTLLVHSQHATPNVVANATRKHIFRDPNMCYYEYLGNYTLF